MVPARSVQILLRPSVLCGLTVGDWGLPASPASHGHPRTPTASLETAPFCRGMVCCGGVAAFPSHTRKVLVLGVHSSRPGGEPEYISSPPLSPQHLKDGAKSLEDQRIRGRLC